jgi:hypothetical protein
VFTGSWRASSSSAWYLSVAESDLGRNAVIAEMEFLPNLAALWIRHS